MLKIRLSRTGKKSQPNFRVVLQEHAMAVKGKALELLGYYKPTSDPKVFKVDLERIKYWLSKGAQPSDSLAVLLKNEGVEGMDRFIAPRDKQKKKKTTEEIAGARDESPKDGADREEKGEKQEPAEKQPEAEKPAEEPKTEEKPE